MPAPADDWDGDEDGLGLFRGMMIGCLPALALWALAIAVVWWAW